LTPTAVWPASCPRRISCSRRPGGHDFFVGRRRRLERNKADGLVASQIMSRPAITICPDAPLAEAARLMHREGVKRLPVVDAEERLVGIVSRADLLRVFLRSDEEICRKVTREVIERTLWIDPPTIEVLVHEGVVILQGVAERKSLIPIILEFVKQVDGVIGVESHISYDIDDEIHHSLGGDRGRHEARTLTRTSRSGESREKVTGPGR